MLGVMPNVVIVGICYPCVWKLRLLISVLNLHFDMTKSFESLDISKRRITC
jgi:hypothetical protein